jgi:hypothetical protein
VNIESQQGVNNITPPDGKENKTAKRCEQIQV